jgi:hypothetical protein
MICAAIPCLPRSGSSMVAGIAARLGFDMGPEGPVRPTAKENPLGFHEDWRFIQFHRWFSARANLADLGGFRAKLRMPPLDPAFGPEEKVRYRKFVAACEAPGRNWGVKDPELTYYFPRFAETVTSEIRVIIPTRALDEVAKSLFQHWYRFCITADECRRAAEEYAARLDILIADWTGPLLQIDYRTCLAEPESHVQALAEFLGVPPVADAAAFVKPDLRHHRAVP